MIEWVLQPLENIATTARAFAMGPFGSNIKTENFVSQGVPVIQGRNLGGTRLDEQGFVFLTGEKADELSSSVAVSGDIVFTHRGTLGQVAMIPRKSRYERYVISQSQMKVTVDEMKALPEFVTYWFQSRLGQAELFAYASQTGVPAIAQPLTSLRKMKVICPPLAEQRAIAGVLGALDDKIESNRRLASACDELAAGILVAGLNQGITTCTVGDVAEFKNKSRKPLSSLQRAEMTGNRVYPYYGATGVFDYVDDYLFDELTVLVGEDGSVVNDDGSPVVQMAWGKYWVNNHAHVLVGSSIQSEVLYVALRRSDIRPLVTGAVQAKVSMGNLRSLVLELPPESLWEALGKEIRDIVSRMRSSHDESASLKALRDALLPELLSGRLRVRDAEKVVEETV